MTDEFRDDERTRAERPKIALFEDRYGEGSYQRLLSLLAQPCVTFAEIATTFGVTRERVRQWHGQWLSDAPSGHARQRLCRVRRRKRRLLEDPLFRGFYRDAREHVSDRRIHLIAASSGFRARAVRIDERLVAISVAEPLPAEKAGASPPAYRLRRDRDAADFLYYRLTDEDYLFLPRSEIPAGGGIFLDSTGSKYQGFKNTFDALGSGVGSQPVSA